MWEMQKMSGIFFCLRMHQTVFDNRKGFTLLSHGIGHAARALSISHARVVIFRQTKQKGHPIRVALVFY
jgi:hypothetical protein